MVALQNATQGAIPLFGFKVSHRVRGCLGALVYTELGKDSTRMVLCCLGANEKTRCDLGVRQAFSEEPQYLDLPLSEQPCRSRAGTAFRSERAHERRCHVRLAAVAQSFQLVSSLPCCVDRNLGEAGRESSCEREAGARDVLSEAERRKAVEGFLQLRNSWHMVAACRRGSPTCKRRPLLLSALCLTGRRLPR
jgi:hypothetical protein